MKFGFFVLLILYATIGKGQSFPPNLDSLSLDQLMQLKKDLKVISIQNEYRQREKFDLAMDSLSLQFQTEKKSQNSKTKASVERISNEAYAAVQNLKARAERSFNKIDFSLEFHDLEEKYAQRIEIVKQEEKNLITALERKWQVIFDQQERLYAQQILEDRQTLLKKIEKIERLIVLKTKEQ